MGLLILVWRMKGRLCLAGMLVLVGGYLLGPRVRVQEPVEPVVVPSTISDLDDWLNERESVVTDLVAGTEKQILWHRGTVERTRVSVVYIHGFAASRQELAPLPQQVATALEANLFSTRLSAHGRNADAFGDVEPGEWLQDADEALAIGRMLGDHVVVIGSSTGGTLAMWLATQNPDLAAAALLSPNFGLRVESAWQRTQKSLVQGPWGKRLALQFAGPYYTQFEPVSADHARFWTPQYRTEGLVSLLALVSFSRQLNVQQVTTPCLFVTSPHDNVIDVTSIQSVYGRLGSPVKQLCELDTASGHVLAGDILSPDTTDELTTRIVEFIHAHVEP